MGRHLATISAGISTDRTNRRRYSPCYVDSKRYSSACNTHCTSERQVFCTKSAQSSTGVAHTLTTPEKTMLLMARKFGTPPPLHKLRAPVTVSPFARLSNILLLSVAKGNLRKYGQQRDKTSLCLDPHYVKDGTPCNTLEEQNAQTMLNGNHATTLNMSPRRGSHK